MATSTTVAEAEIRPIQMNLRNASGELMPCVGRAYVFLTDSKTKRRRRIDTIVVQKKAMKERMLVGLRDLKSLRFLSAEWPEDRPEA